MITEELVFEAIREYTSCSVYPGVREIQDFLQEKLQLPDLPKTKEIYEHLIRLQRTDWIVYDFRQGGYKVK